MTRICEYENCGIEFEPKRADQAYCCRRHKDAQWRKDHKKACHITNEKASLKVPWFKCPTCGMTVPLSRLNEQYELELMYKIVKGGRGGLSFIRGKQLTEGDVPALKQKLTFIFRDLIFQYAELNGCQFWANCLTCPRDPETQCPDKVRGLAQKLKKAPRKQRAKELEGKMTTAEIARELGVCEKTVKRDQKEGK